MGNTCKSGPDIREFVSIPQPTYTNMHYKSPAQSIRMGDVQRLRSANMYQPNRFNFILSVKESQQIIKVQCPVVSSYADNLSLKVPILGTSDTVRLDARNPPIIDTHDINSDRQILHKFIARGQMNEQQRYCVKVYPFNGYYDDAFKTGLYQASLYRRLESYTKNTILREFFVLEKGKLGSLVFIFNSFLCTLEDVLLYRKYANLPYSKVQQNYIADQILQRYKVLNINNIVHRDIRPSKIYLAESSNNRNPYISNSGHLGYELLNLQSARRLTQRQILMHGQLTGNSDMLMTVRGVPLFCNDAVKNLHMRGDHAGIYDPWMNDRQQLAKTISMIVTLSTDTTIDSNQSLVKKHNKDIYALIKKLQDKKQPLQHIIRQFSQQFGSSSSSKSMSVNRGILQSDYDICMNHLPVLIKNNNEQRIEECTTEMLLALNQRDMYSQRMDRMLSANYRDNRPYDNVAVLDRLGRHYEALGYKDNDYYAEELNLLTMMSEDYRVRGYPTDNIYEQSAEIYDGKFGGRAKTPAADIEYRIENAYRALAKGDKQAAYTIINNAVLQGVNMGNLPVDTQIRAIKAKGIIESQVNGPDAGDSIFNQGLNLCSNRNNFTTQVQMLEEKSNFQHYLAKNMVNRMMHNKYQMPPQVLAQELAKCEALLIQARDIKVDIPVKSTVPIADVYETFGDMEMIRENPAEAAKDYNKSYQLLQASGVEISSQNKIRVLNKLHGLLRQNQRNYGEEEKVRNIIKNLQSKERMQESASRSDRRFFDRIRYLRNKGKNEGRIFGQGTNMIPQADQRLQEDASKYYSRNPTNEMMNIPINTLDSNQINPGNHPIAEEVHYN